MKMKWLTTESLWHIEDLVVSSWAVWGWTSRWSSSEWWLTPWRMTSSQRWSSICRSSWSPNDLWGRYSSHEMPLVISDFGEPSNWWWTRTRMTPTSYNPPSSSTWSYWPPTVISQRWSLDFLLTPKKSKPDQDDLLLLHLPLLPPPPTPLLYRDPVWGGSHCQGESLKIHQIITFENISSKRNIPTIFINLLLLLSSWWVWRFRMKNVLW